MAEDRTDIEQALAVGQAVMALPFENLSIRRCPTDDEYQWCVAIDATGYVVGCGNTLDAAIAAALGEEATDE